MNNQQIEYHQFTRKSLLGGGAFGRVWLGEYNGAEVAIKEVMPTSDMKYVIGEMQILSSVRHPNIIALYGICVCDEGIFIITELSTGGDLRSYLKKHPRTPLVLKLKFLKEAASAMLYVHGRNIIHRDLKSDNLLVTGEGSIKLCDFGLARTTTREGTDFTAQIGTMEYMAPEVINSEPYNNSVDVFSFGVLMYELFTLERPPKRKPLLGFPFIPAIACPPEVPPELWELMLKCTSTEPEKRPTFQQVFSTISEHHVQQLKLNPVLSQSSPEITRSPPPPQVERPYHSENKLKTTQAPPPAKESQSQVPSTKTPKTSTPTKKTHSSVPRPAGGGGVAGGGGGSGREKVSTSGEKVTRPPPVSASSPAEQPVHPRPTATQQQQPRNPTTTKPTTTTTSQHETPTRRNTGSNKSSGGVRPAYKGN